MKSSFFCPWILIDFLKVNAIKIQTKVMEKLKSGCCLIVSQEVITLKKATKSGQSVENTVKYTKKYSSNIQYHGFVSFLTSSSMTSSVEELP